MQYQWDDTCFSVEQRNDSEHELLRQMLDSTSLAQLYVDFDEKIKEQGNVGDGDVTAEDPQAQLGPAEQISPREHVEILSELAKQFRHYSEEIKQKYFEALIEEYTNKKKGAADFASQVNLQKGKHKIVLDNTLKQGLKEIDTLLSESLVSKKEQIQMAALQQMVRVQKKVNEYMGNRYRKMADDQSKICNEECENMIAAKRAQLKEAFIQKVANIQKDLDYKLQDILFEKNLALEKTSDFLDCRTIAAQIYVALKEKEEKDKCIAEIEESIVVEAKKKDKDKKIKKDKDEKIRLTNKVSNIIQKLQQLTEFCLKTMPGHGDFLIDVERIMLMQLNEVCEDVNAESLFEAEKIFKPNGVTPKPQPYYLCSDTTNQETDLLLKNSMFSNIRLPAIIVGRRLIYSTDDNIDMYSEVLRHLSNSGNQAIPAKITNSDLRQFKLERPITKFIKKPEVRNFATQCNICKLHCCSCDIPQTHEQEDVDGASLRFPNTEFNTLQNRWERRSAQPKLQSHINLLTPQRSRSKLLAKKQLKSYLPTYMRTSSSLEQAVPTNTLFNLESITARKPNTPAMDVTRNALTQCSDSQFELFCENFFNDMNNILKEFA